MQPLYSLLLFLQINMQRPRKLKLIKPINDSLSIQVLKKFRLIYGSIRQQFREVEETCGISGSQLWLLQEVANTPGIGVSQLAERLSLHQSTCSQLIEKLVKSSLIIKRRSNEDQRRVGLFLDNGAKELLANAPGPTEGILPKALMALPENVLAELDVSLERVIRQMSHSNKKFEGKHLSDM